MSNLNEKLAALKGNYLERDDESDPGGRIYRDKVSGEIYHSVTRILGATAPEEQQKALAKWLERPDLNPNSRHGRSSRHRSPFISRICSQDRSTPRQSNSSKTQQLARIRRWPLSSTKSSHKWALEKAIQGAPRVPWSASGFGSRASRLDPDHVTAIHSIEFSAFHPAGFAGACDALVDLDGEGPFIVDWKTTGKSIHKSNESQLVNYRAQLGAYSLMLNYRSDIQARVERSSLPADREHQL